ncbi:MAG: hypothetical protein ABSD57_14580 [Verrucomicrobiota bacterium]
MKTKLFYAIIITGLAGMNCPAEDITTLDGQKYENVSDLKVRPDSIFFLVRTEGSVKGVKVSFSNLPDDLKKKYNYDPYEEGLYIARQNHPVYLKKDLAFSLGNLEAAKKKAKAENKMIGFIMEWDSMFVSAYPMGQGSDCGLAHFYDVFHNNLVLVFVRHESELDKVPDAVKKGFNGPEEGGFAPNMAVVTADCSQFVCEIPYGGNNSNGQIREQIFRQKIAVIKKFVESQQASKSQTK